MPSERKFHKTTFEVVILSEAPIEDHCDLTDVLREAENGDYVGDARIAKREELDGKEAADALHKMGSEPGFFMLDDDGEDEDE